MKFIWNEPAEKTNSDGTRLRFPRMHWELPLLGWLNYCGVWPEREKIFTELEYNYTWHFFDIIIFKDDRFGHGGPTCVIDQMRKYLESSGLDWCEKGTFRWEDHKQIDGVRFWIQAEDYPNKDRWRPKP